MGSSAEAVMTIPLSNGSCSPQDYDYHPEHFLKQNRLGHLERLIPQ